MEAVVLEIDKENRRLSLGHKQLEENPWDVFETVFKIGSVHQGTIIQRNDKGGVVTYLTVLKDLLQVAIYQSRWIEGSNEETLDFQIIEFNKDSKKIIVSHTKTFEQQPDRGRCKRRKAQV